ncbi:hypothetical protein M3Y99_00489800 [Aphelenchoides fujianensis]|nr:hypothetical protein M3Y99_00489800 [Aphelenchoides fujianensis]
MHCTDAYMAATSSPAMYYHSHHLHPTGSATNGINGSGNAYMNDQYANIMAAAAMGGHHQNATAAAAAVNAFGMPTLPQNAFGMAAGQPSVTLHTQPPMLNENIMAAAVSYASTAVSWPVATAVSMAQQQQMQQPNGTAAYSPQRSSPANVPQQAPSSAQHPQSAEQPPYPWMKVKRVTVKTPVTKQRRQPIPVDPSNNNPNRTNFSNHQLTELEKDRIERAAAAGRTARPPLPRPLRRSRPSSLSDSSTVSSTNISAGSPVPSPDHLQRGLKSSPC